MLKITVYNYQLFIRGKVDFEAISEDLFEKTAKIFKSGANVIYFL